MSEKIQTTIRNYTITTERKNHIFVGYCQDKSGMYITRKHGILEHYQEPVIKEIDTYDADKAHAYAVDYFKMRLRITNNPLIDNFDYVGTIGFVYINIENFNFYTIGNVVKLVKEAIKANTTMAYDVDVLVEKSGLYQNIIVRYELVKPYMWHDSSERDSWYRYGQDAIANRIKNMLGL